MDSITVGLGVLCCFLFNERILIRRPLLEKSEAGGHTMEMKADAGY